MRDKPIDLSGGNDGDINTTTHNSKINDTLNTAEAQGKEQSQKFAAVAKAAKKEGK